MRDNHVAVGTRTLVEARAVIDAERLGDVDLHVIDVVPIPDRFEHPVGESQRDQVLDGLSAQKVVDAKHTVLRHEAVHELVEVACRLQVHAEGLLKHHTSSLRQSRLAQCADRGTERRRGDRQVIQAAWFAA